MKEPMESSSASPASTLVTELLILPDGQILVHNLTQPFAELLKELNPAEEQISSRAAAKPETRNPKPLDELPD